MRRSGKIPILFGDVKIKDFETIVDVNYENEEDASAPLTTGVDIATTPGVGTYNVVADTDSQIGISSGALVFGGAGASTAYTSEAVRFDSAAKTEVPEIGDVLILEMATDVGEDRHGYLSLGGNSQYPREFRLGSEWYYNTAGVAETDGDHFALVLIFSQMGWLQCFYDYASDEYRVLGTIRTLTDYNTGCTTSAGAWPVAPSGNPNGLGAGLYRPVRLDFRGDAGVTLYRLRWLRPVSGRAKRLLGTSSAMNASAARYLGDNTIQDAAEANAWALARWNCLGSGGGYNQMMLRADGDGYGISLRLTNKTQLDLIRIDSEGETVLDTAGLPSTPGDNAEVCGALYCSGSTIIGKLWGAMGDATRYTGALTQVSATSSFNSTESSATSFRFSSSGGGNIYSYTVNSLEPNGAAGCTAFPSAGDVIASGLDGDQVVVVRVEHPPVSGSVDIAVRYVDDDNYIVLRIPSTGACALVQADSGVESTLSTEDGGPLVDNLDDYNAHIVVTLSGNTAKIMTTGAVASTTDGTWPTSSGAGHTTAGTVKVMSLGGGGSAVLWVAAWPRLDVDRARVLGFNRAASVSDGGGEFSRVWSLPTTTLSTVVESTNIDEIAGLTDVGGDAWIVIGWYPEAVVPHEFTAVNLDTGATWMTSADSDITRPAILAYDSTNDCLIVSGETNPIAAIDLSTGAYTYLGGPSYARQAYRAAWGLSDGYLYIGCYGSAGNGGEVLRYDPSDQSLTSLGVPDPTDLGGVYAYHIAAQCVDDWFYTSLAYGQTAAWRLAKLNLSTGIWSVEIPDGVGASVCSVQRHTDGYCYVSQGGTVWRAVEGVLTEMTGPGAITEDARKGLTTDATLLETVTGYEVDLDQIDALDSHDPELGYQPSGSSDPMTIATWSGLTTTPQQTFRGAWDADTDRLLIWCRTYGPLAWYDPATHVSAVVGVPQYSGYSVLLGDADIGSGTDRICLLAGYTAISMVWRVDQPWTLSRSVSAFAGEGTVNPWREWGIHKYHYFEEWTDGAVEGVKRYVATGVNAIRDKVGAFLGIEDLLTRTYLEFRDDFSGEDWAVRGIDWSPDGSMLALALASRAGADGKVFILTRTDLLADDWTSAVVQEVTPLSGSTSPGRVRWLDNSTVVGAEGLVVYTIAASDGAVTERINPLPSEAYAGVTYAYDQHLEVHGGYVYFWVGTALARAKSSDWTLENVSACSPGEMVFNGSTLYLLGTSSVRSISLPEET